MSVILTKEAVLSFRKPDSVCFECNGRLHYPFVEWKNLFICAKCCHDIKNGLMADMVQAAAIAELRSLGYRGMTLVRSNVDAVEQADLKEAARMGVPRNDAA